MNKYELQSKLKSSSTAYLLYFFLFGSHFAYLNRWGLQLLFWFTAYGFFVWGFIELFLISGRVQKHNARIYQQLDAIEKRESEEAMARNIAMIKASK